MQCLYCYLMQPAEINREELNVPKYSVLIIFAHPYLHRSRVNHRLIEKVKGLDGVVVNDLYQTYSNFHIDTELEQVLTRMFHLGTR